MIFDDQNLHELHYEDEVADKDDNLLIVIQRNLVKDRRWGNDWEVIFKYLDKYYRFSYYAEREEDPEYDSCDCPEVFPHKIMTIVYKDTPA